MVIEIGLPEKPPGCSEAMAGEIGPWAVSLSVLAQSAAEEPTIKKKSFFQITSVKKVRQGEESFSSDVGGADLLDMDGEDDGEEEDGDEDGEETEDDEAREYSEVSHMVNDVVTDTVPDSLPPSRSSSIPSEANAAQPAPASARGSLSRSSTSSSVGTNGLVPGHSKFRLVRIAKGKIASVNKRYSRGRWTCWDYTSDTQEALPEHSAERRSPAGSMTNASALTGDDSSTATSSNRKEVKFKRLVGSSSGESRAAHGALNGQTDEASEASGAELSSARATGAGATTEQRAHAGAEDQFAERNGDSSSRRLDSVLRSVSDLIRHYAAEEQQSTVSLRQCNAKLSSRVTELEQREYHLLHELEKVRTDYQRVLEENKRIVMYCEHLQSRLSSNTAS